MNNSNGPMGDQIKKELMAEAKKNMTPGWEDEDVIQSAGTNTQHTKFVLEANFLSPKVIILTFHFKFWNFVTGQQELFEGPEDTMGKSESRIGGFESVVTLEVPSNTNVVASGMKKKNKKK